MHQVTVVNEFTPYSSQHQIKILKNCSMRARYIIQSVYRKYICRSLGIPLPPNTPTSPPPHPHPPPSPHPPPPPTPHRNPRESVAHRVGSTRPDVFHQLGTSHVLRVEFNIIFIEIKWYRFPLLGYVFNSFWAVFVFSLLSFCPLT